MRERNQKALTPDTHKREDHSDELSNLFDDGTKLGEETKQLPTPVTGVTGVTGDIAPRRDFTRVANSVVRDAIPAGVFTGKGKQLYDYLYSQTRGAIVPTVSARIPTERVMSGAGMTRHTYRSHLQRLVSSGLIKVEEKPGEHGGNVFTVYLPEEIGLKRGDRGDRGDRGQNLPLVQGSEIDPGDRGLSEVGTITSVLPKTSFKTNTIDDEATVALSDFNAALCEATQKLTGRTPKAADREQWATLAGVIVGELEEAAARAESVSNVPAFLTAHMRRKLAHKSHAGHRAGNQKAKAPEQDAPSVSDPNRRLQPEEIAEQAHIIAELLENGYTLGQAEAQFAASAHPDDWRAILEQAVTDTAAKI